MLVPLTMNTPWPQYIWVSNLYASSPLYRKVSNLYDWFLIGRVSPIVLKGQPWSVWHAYSEEKKQETEKSKYF